MNITLSNTESVLQFHRFHERLNRSLKVQAIGLGLLADEIEAGTSAKEIKDRLYARPGWLWGGMPDWSGARSEVDAALRDVGQSGVVRAFSAFDLFLTNLFAEITSWSDFAGVRIIASSNAETNDDGVDRLERVYQVLGENRSRISDFWPVYSYFRISRNCIAHREGLASAALVEAYSDPALEPTLDRWIERTGELTAPALVDVREGEQIHFNHRQAIAASSCLRLIVMDLGRLAVEKLGEKGFVYLAARRAFFDDPPLPETLEMSTMTKAFNKVMSGRYRIPKYDYLEGLKLLRELDLAQKCSINFKNIKIKHNQKEGSINKSGDGQ